ncbi:MAG: hypothetical protein LEGION0398_MBIBDBAK_00467 [Legionellaceae bacterium]
MYTLNRKYYFWILILVCLALTGCTGSGTIKTFFTNFSKLSGNFQRLITGITYLLGLMFAFKGVYALKLYGEARTMMSNHANLKIPAIYLLVSAVFMYLPTALNTVNQGIFGSDTPLGYRNALLTSSRAYLEGVFSFIRIIGLLSFVRGWLILAALAQQGGHQNTSGKAMTHIVGGVLAYNIEATITLLQSIYS